MIEPALTIPDDIERATSPRQASSRHDELCRACRTDRFDCERCFVDELPDQLTANEPAS